MHFRSGLSRFSIPVAALLAALAFGAPGSALADGRDGDRSRARASFESTGEDDDAEGRMHIDFKRKRSVLKAKFSGLAPAQTYDLDVDDDSVAQVETDDDGDARLRMKSRDRRKGLGFDPRGKRIALRRGDTDVLEMVLSGPGEPDDSRVEERARLDRVDDGATGTVVARYRVKRDGERRFDIEASNVQPGSYGLVVDGLEVAILDAADPDEHWRFSTEPDDSDDPDGDEDEMLLEFDPRGQVVELVGDDGMVDFSGILRADASGVNRCRHREIESDLSLVDAAAAGAVQAKWERESDCDEKFEVEIEDAPEGTYTLLVGGTERGDFDVDEEGEGEIEFETDADGDGDEVEQPLDFDVIDELIEVARDGTVWWSGVLTANAEGDDDSEGDCREFEMRLPLMVEPAAIAGAEGDVDIEIDDDCDEKVEVEIEDVPLGDYDVRFDGVVRGVIEVVQDDDGRREGEVEWESDSDDDSLLLDFEWRGALLEVGRGDEVWFTRVLPD